MEATLTLHQAGDRLGVDDTDLNRLIRIGALPEARKVDRPEGRVWTIDEEHLPAIASRNGWTIDLRADTAGDGGPACDPRTETRTGTDTGSVVLHRSGQPEAVDGDATMQPADPGPDSTVALFDQAILDRLLVAHEERVAAEVKEQEARHALAALNDAHNRVTGELEVERRERMATAERFREERRSRAVAEAKVAELRDRVDREMALAESEKTAQSQAMDRTIRAEWEAANAVALLGWRARRRYQKLVQRPR